MRTMFVANSKGAHLFIEIDGCFLKQQGESLNELVSHRAQAIRGFQRPCTS